MTIQLGPCKFKQAQPSYITREHEEPLRRLSRFPEVAKMPHSSVDGAKNEPLAARPVMRSSAAQHITLLLQSYLASYY